MVRFSQNFDDSEEAAEDDGRRLSSKPPLAPSGGSVSLAAQHFCPVCGIIATSQDNLEVPFCCSPCNLSKHEAHLAQTAVRWLRSSQGVGYVGTALQAARAKQEGGHRILG